MPEASTSEISRVMATLGAKGGHSTSEAKKAAVRLNLAKARAARKPRENALQAVLSAN